MDANPTPVVKDLVLIGGGHSHVHVIKSFGMKTLPGVRLTLIVRDVHTPYSGMLPGYIAGHYSHDECHIDLLPLARFAGARLFHDEVIGVDLAAKQVQCRSRPPVPYDLLSINIGSRPRRTDAPGSAEFATPVKPIDGFSRRWEAIVARVLASDRRLRIGVVGGGAAGVELTLAMQFRLRHLLGEQGKDPELCEFHLVTAGMILPTHNARVRATFMRVLAERGVTLHLDSKVSGVEGGRVLREGAAAIELDEILWVTQAGAAPWLKASGFATDQNDFVLIRDTLQTVTDPMVFAVGDIATSTVHPREKAGVFAVRQGPPLAANLRRALVGEPLRPFAPQRKFLSLISTGDKYAVASRGPWAYSGRGMWQLKDWIDRRFMRKFSELPDMATAAAPSVAQGLAGPEAIKEISAIAMRCGGCGAKVGSTVLSRVMNRLHPIGRDDVLIGLAAPDDAAAVRVPPGKVMVHTVDYFRAFIDDPYVFGQIAATHSLGDIYAMGAEPQTALAIASVPYGLEAKVEDTLFQMMSGATEVLGAHDAALVGGHTSEAAELGLGFAINGLADESKLWRKGGMRPGDALILTKPIGTGTLFAAEMRRKAKGRWIDAAIESMILSPRAAAAIFRQHGAGACTDITGFGLLGHLVEMTKASEVDVELHFEAVPLLDGAAETVGLGIFSSLQPQNLRLRRALRNAEQAAGEARHALLFDPQTAGGLLASVPAERAEACLAELRRGGYPRAAIIGRVLPRSDALEPIVLAARPTSAARRSALVPA